MEKFYDLVNGNELELMEERSNGRALYKDKDADPYYPARVVLKAGMAVCLPPLNPIYRGVHPLKNIPAPPPKRECSCKI